MMFIKTFLIFILFQSFADAQLLNGFTNVSKSTNCSSCQPEVPAAQRSTVRATGDTVTAMIAKLPEGETKKGLEEYVAAMGYDSYKEDNSVSSGNLGMAAYFSKRFSDKKNSCVRDAARGFYGEIAKVLKAKTSAGQSCGFKGPELNELGVVSEPDYGCHSIDIKRSGILDQVGDGEYKELQPGWVWDLALKHAKGDPNSAMFLIGMCGHDDVNQGTYSFSDSSSAALDLKDEAYKQLLQVKKEEEVELKELKINYDLNVSDIKFQEQSVSLINQKLSALKDSSTLSTLMHCPPQNSGYYAAQSLGKNADIPRALKQEIHSVQTQVDGAQNTAGKYYHVYASAFMACQLVQNGFSPENASRLQQQAARFYRGTRMCEHINRIEDTDAKVTARNEMLMKDLMVDRPEALSVAVVRRAQRSGLACNTNPDEKTMAQCLFLYDLGLSPSMLPLMEISDQEIQAKFEAKKRNVDAAQLYRNWYAGGGRVFGKEIPCSDVRVLGPSDLMKPQESFFAKLFKPSDWSDQRFQRASQKLATWDLDYKWTIAQHKTGAEFAGKHCRPRPEGQGPLAGICPGGPPDGSTPGSMGGAASGKSGGSQPQSGVK